VKRRLLLQRAEEAKRRIDAQNFKKDQNLANTQKTAFEVLEDCKYLTKKLCSISM
jgi:hypothetical protein